MRVIISGAGIAGLALAYWLDRIGASSIVIERQPSFQALGHYISLKGNGVEMVRRMGIFDACQARAAPIEETRMYAASGRFLRSEHTTALAQTLGGYILFRRADLQAALYDLARECAVIRFGLQISEARLAPDGVEVVLSDGGTERADMGSSLALQDAHILAGCLARSPDDIAAAFSRYEEVVTPIARRYRDSALNARRVILGRGRLQTHLRDLALRLMPERLLERGIRRFVDAERPLVDVPVAARDLFRQRTAV